MRLGSVRATGAAGQSWALAEHAVRACVRAVAKELGKRGFGRAYVLAGGYQAWTNSKLKTKGSSVVGGTSWRAVAGVLRPLRCTAGCALLRNWQACISCRLRATVTVGVAGFQCVCLGLTRAQVSNVEVLEGSVWGTFSSRPKTTSGARTVKSLPAVRGQCVDGGGGAGGGRFCCDFICCCFIAAMPA